MFLVDEHWIKGEHILQGIQRGYNCQAYICMPMQYFNDLY